MKTYPKIYVDEAGSTGSNILDSVQPYFVLSAVHFSDNELNQIRKDITYDKEIHFVDMKKNSEGRQKIKQILLHPLVNEDHVFIQFINKRFCIYNQIVDVIIEPVLQFKCGIDLYCGQENIKLANRLYDNCEKHGQKAAVNYFIHSFENMMRLQTDESINDFYHSVDILSGLSHGDLRDILAYIRSGEDFKENILTYDSKYCLDTTMTSLVNLSWQWNEKLDRDLDIIIDESEQIKENIQIIMKFSNKDITPISVSYDSRKQRYPLPIHSILMKDSKTDFGLQLADIIASSIAFAYNTSSKYGKFREELKKLPIKGFNVCSIVPAGIGSKLLQGLDD